MERVRQLLVTAHAAKVFPAAAIEVGRTKGPVWQEAIGRLSDDTDAPACRLDTIFDLASLTKVIATSSIAMRLVAEHRLSLDLPVAGLIDSWQGHGRSSITPRHLLDHSSGLAAHARLWKSSPDRESVVAALERLSPTRPAGQAAVYSDLAFMLLGLVLETAGGSPLDALFEPLASHRGDVLCYRPPAALWPRIAPTEFSPSLGRHLRGDVHDENAAALGGVAAHAGLFGTARSVGVFARLVLETFRQATPLGTPELMRVFAQPSTVAGSSRALGWDTMRPTSSCGTLFSRSAIGHTGFTGTSLWIDWERDLYVVLLTNRVYPSRDDERLVGLRPRVHERIVEAFSKTGR
jgi:CubicO group peptidase (beta-lactamase class C family)